MEKIIHSLIDNWIKGVDTYTHNGSTWLIFTDNKQWVIELTEQKTLWYNYNFFKQIFEFTSLDVVDNQHYITKWVEDNIINKVEHTSKSLPRKCSSVDDVIENGVKETLNFDEKHTLSYEQGVKKLVEDTIENGTKETKMGSKMNDLFVEDTIKNGVKETICHDCDSNEIMADIVIKTGVKETNWFEGPMRSVVDNVIDDGINHTEIGWHQCNNVDDVIDKGIKKIISRENPSTMVDIVVDNGVKETFDFMEQNISEWQVDEVIDNGVKETKVSDYFGDNAETFITDQYIIDRVIENGVKKTKTPGKDGDIMSTVEWMNENNSSSYTKMIDDVIENGVKKTHGVSKNLFWEIGDTIQNGVKKTISRENPSTMVDDIIKKTKADASQNPMGKVTEVLRDGKVSK